MNACVLNLLLLLIVLPTFAQTTWTGSTSGNWATATNWDTNAVPTDSTDIVIPNVANGPLIGAGTGALANSVAVQSGASLSIVTNGSLTINGFRILDIDGTTAAFSNSGTVNNDGQLIIGNLASVGQIGLWNKGTFNNNTGGVVRIDRSTTAGLYNEPTGSFIPFATFTNKASLVIGAAAPVGSYGLFNHGNFFNNEGGVIQIDRSTTAGLNNEFVATFTNKASLVIGAVDSVGAYGLFNQGNFFNNEGGVIQIDRSTTAGLNNEFVTTFTNKASLVIGAAAPVGAYGLFNQGNFFNNEGGVIQIDRSTTAGLNNEFVATFTNKASLVIGATAPVGDYGLFNIAALYNGGQIQIDRSTQYSLVNELNTLGIALPPFTNGGSIVIGSIGSMGAHGFFNNAPFLNTVGATLSLFTTP